MCLLYCLGIRKGLKNQNINLNELQIFKGIVSDLGETVRRSGKYDADVFYIDINGLNQRLGVYRSSKNYSSLTSELNIGDTVKVYFKSGGPEDVNIDLIQIEKSRKVILNKKEYEEKQSFLIWVCAVATILTLLVAAWHFKKNMWTNRKKTYH